jgi:hypothetical protein
MPHRPEVRRTISKDTADPYELIGNKPVPYGSRKKMVPGMYFASVVACKEMVSFTLFPLDYHERECRNIAPTLMRFLKGKSCFNFKQEEEVAEQELRAILTKGVQRWRTPGSVQ